MARGNRARPITVLVEGQSDRIALTVLATRLGVARPRIVVIGGAQAARRARAEILAERPEERLLGLVDVADLAAFERAGFAPADAADPGPTSSAVFVCDRDLEDELIRALGEERTLGIIEAQGEAASFRILQRQPDQRDRSVADQLRRFLGGRSGNKARYAQLFAGAVDLSRVPPPLAGLLAAVGSPSPR